jgi:hypothetical protein
MGWPADSNLKHGYAKRGAKTPTYKTWESMIRRCTMPSQDSYPIYGGRGISVCERWRDFENFLADMGEKPDGMTIERNDGDGDYEPGNCRWASQQEQQRNRRGNRFLTHNGITATVAEWSDRTGIKSATIRTRIDKFKWSAEEALRTPARKMTRK